MTARMIARPEVLPVSAATAYTADRLSHLPAPHAAPTAKKLAVRLADLIEALPLDESGYCVLHNRLVSITRLRHFGETATARHEALDVRNRIARLGRN